MIVSSPTLLHTACDASADAMLLFGYAANEGGWQCIYQNSAFSSLTGFSQADVEGQSPLFLCDMRDADAVQSIQQVFSSAFTQKSESKLPPQHTKLRLICYKKKSSSTNAAEHFHAEMSVSVFLHEGKAFAFVVLRDVSLDVLVQEQMFQESTMLYEANKSLREQNKRDELTQVYNRSVIKTDVESLFNAAKRNKTHFSLLFLDIDRFKSINDNYGHDVGDRTLQHIAQLLRSSIVVDRDILLRYGGEEFVICFAGEEKTATLSYAQKIVDTIASSPLVFDTTGMQVSLTASIGVVTAVPLKEASVSEYILAADLAMYTAKADGGNGFSVAKKP